MRTEEKINKTIDFVLYTIVDPQENGYCKFIDELGDIISDESVEEHVLQYNDGCRPSILSLRRETCIQDKDKPIKYYIDGSYRLMVGPADNGSHMHIQQVDNDVFIDHVFLAEAANLLQR